MSEIKFGRKNSFIEVADSKVYPASTLPAKGSEDPLRAAVVGYQVSFFSFKKPF